jgi:hypothetical protein
MMSRPIQCESSPTRMSRRDPGVIHVGGMADVAGIPIYVSHCIAQSRVRDYPACRATWDPQMILTLGARNPGLSWENRGVYGEAAYI